MRASRISRLLLWLLVLAFVCVGCDSGPEESLFPEVSISPMGGPSAGGQLTIAIPEGVASLHPLTLTNRAMNSLAGLIFEPLIFFDETGTPQPMLARDWTVDDTGLIWTLTLRQGVTWQGDGRAFTADDVVFTLDLMEELGDDCRYGEILPYLEDWQAVDDSTVLLTLSTPFYGIINGLDFPILPQNKGYTADTAPINPVGTGPYVVTSYDAVKGIKLVINPNWWKKAPYIESITAVPFANNEEATSSLLLGQLDVLQTDSLTATQYRDSGDAGIYEYSTRYFEALVPNMNSLYLQDKRIRQAIAYALNRREIVSNVYVNHAIVVDTPVPSTSWLYQDRLLVYEHDVEEARQLIKLAGWKTDGNSKWLTITPDGREESLTLQLLTYDEPDRSLRYDVARLIQSNLAEVGIKVEIRAEDWDTFVQVARDGNFDLMLGGWYLSDIPDLTFLLGSGQAGNLSRYTSTRMDELLGQALEQSTDGGLLHTYEQIQVLITDDLPIISLYFRTHTLMTTLPVTGVTNIAEENAYGGIAGWYINTTVQSP